MGPQSCSPLVTAPICVHNFNELGRGKKSVRKGARGSLCLGRDRKVACFLLPRAFCTWGSIGLEGSSSKYPTQLLHHSIWASVQCCLLQSSLTILSKIEPIQLSTPLLQLIFLLPSDMYVLMYNHLFVYSISFPVEE